MQTLLQSRSRLSLVIGWLSLFCFWSTVGWAETKEDPSPEPRPTPQVQETLAQLRNRTLIIATKLSPPFSMKDEGGRWTGISIELWREIALELKLKFKFKEMPLHQMLEATRTGKADVAVASLTITPERERFLDFTHSFYSTGLGIAVSPQKSGGTVLVAMRKLFSWEIMRFFVILFAVLLLMGAIVWWFERKENPEEFGGNAVSGIGAGVWWSIVTMTTVGYGDKAPRTFLGRTIAAMWIFMGLVLVSSLTATLTTLLTVSQLESSIKGPQDLYKLHVATVDKSTSMRYLQRRRVNKIYTVPNVYEGMRAVADGKAEAMVYDAPLLKYIAANQLQGAVMVLPHIFERQDYGIALPDKSPLREAANRVLLRFIYSERWNGLLRRYLGK